MVMCRLMRLPAATSDERPKVFALTTVTPIVRHHFPIDGPAEALPYGSSSIPVAVKSVRFGQQQQTALQQAARGQQKTEEAERAAGETKDALAEATIDLVIPGNMAMAFDRDFRRERMGANPAPSSKHNHDRPSGCRQLLGRNNNNNRRPSEQPATKK